MKIEDITSKVPEEASKNKKIRNVYLELGKFFRIDINFFYGTDEEKIKIYYAKTDPKKIERKR